MDNHEAFDIEYPDIYTETYPQVEEVEEVIGNDHEEADVKHPIDTDVGTGAKENTDIYLSKYKYWKSKLKCLLYVSLR